MNTRTQRYREQIHTHSHEHHRVLPPIRVTVALVSRWGPGDFYERSNRQVLSFNLITRGNMLYRQASNQGVLFPGDLFIAHKAKDQRFETGDSGFLHKRTILVEGIGLDAIMQVTGLTAIDHIKFSEPARITKLFRRCYKLMREKPPGFASELSLLAYSLVIECSECAGPNYPPPLHAAIEYMEQNLRSTPRLPAIASAAGLSARNCTRLFRQHLRDSPMSFFIGLRIKAAEAMLMHSELSIKQIGMELGYEDQFHFSSQFKQRTGQSPRAFRVGYKKQKNGL
jgi:AraC-like DNA-binding protein